MPLLLILGLILFSPVISLAAAETSPDSVQQVLDKLESRRGIWMGLEADLTLQFSNSDSRASCEGKLTYDRLREKVTLDCSNQKNELLFTYKTLDLNFQLYLPGQKKLIRGNIFDLQFDPDVSVYLLPQDLYRALKPMLIEPGMARITEEAPQILKLNVLKDGPDHSPYLARTLRVTKQGDVPEEAFYQQNGTPEVLIRRSDFIEVKMSDLKKKISYPRLTEIQSLTLPRKTTLLIRHIRFYLRPPAWEDSRTFAEALTEEVKTPGE